MQIKRVVAGYYQVHNDGKHYIIWQMDEGSFRGWWRMYSATDDEEFGLLENEWLEDYPTLRDAREALSS